METVDFDLPGEAAATRRLARAVQGDGKYVRRTPGSPAYGHIKVLLSPHQGPTAYRFEWKVPEGMLPPQYMQPGALAGVRAALLKRLRSGAGVAGVCVSVVDGSYHDTDSSEQSVAIAAQLAVEEALDRATFAES